MIPLFKTYISDYARELVDETLRSGYIAQGPIVDILENLFREYFGTKNIVTLNSCTSALHLSYYLIKNSNQLPDNTEVLCTPVTCWATNLPILHNRMNIKWCDVDENLNINIDDIYRKFTANTRVLSFVHWGGKPVDLDRIKQLKDDYKKKFGKKLFVVEDAAHAFGSTFNSKFIGNYDLDNYICFSFQAIKSLAATSDGGLLICPEESYKEARLSRWFHLDRDNNMDFRHTQDICGLGWKFHMNDVQAAGCIGNFNDALRNIKAQQSNANLFTKLINNDNIIKSSHHQSSCWLYTLFVNDSNKLSMYLTKNNIQSNKVHTRNDKFSICNNFCTNLENVEYLENKRLCIPVGWWLSEHDKDHIIQVLNSYNETMH